MKFKKSVHKNFFMVCGVFVLVLVVIIVLFIQFNNLRKNNIILLSESLTISQYSFQRSKSLLSDRKIYFNSMNYTLPPSWRERVMNRIKKVEIERGEQIPLLISDCNYVDCDLIPLPIYFSPKEASSEGAKNCILHRNFWEIKLYNFVKKLCYRLKGQKKKYGRSTTVNEKTPFVRHDFESFREKKYVRLNEEKCSVGFGWVAEGYERDSDIVFLEHWDEGKMNKLYDASERNLDRKRYVLRSTEPLILSIGVKKIEIKTSWLGQAALKKCDILFHHFPFSDVIFHLGDFHWYAELFKKLVGWMGKGEEFRRKLMQNMNEKDDVLANTFVSNPTSFFRNAYIEEMEKNMKIDHYGRHGFSQGRQRGKYNKVFKEAKKYSQESYAKKIKIQRKYKFSLVFENSIGYNYCTEKLKHTILSSFTIPVYMGALNIDDFFSKGPLKDYKLFINALDFPDPKILVDYLKYLDENDDAYLEYFKWRFDGYDENDLMRLSPKKHNRFCRLREYVYFGKKVCTEEEYDIRYMMMGYYKVAFE